MKKGLDTDSQIFFLVEEIKLRIFQKNSSLQMALVWKIVFDIGYLGLADNTGEL